MGADGAHLAGTAWRNGRVVNYSLQGANRGILTPPAGADPVQNIAIPASRQAGIAFLDAERR